MTSFVSVHVMTMFVCLSVCLGCIKYCSTVIHLKSIPVSEIAFTGVVVEASLGLNGSE